jgi:hypothetical protein
MHDFGPAAPPPAFPPFQAARDEPPWPRMLMAVGTVAVGLWIVAATAGLQVGGWFLTEVAVGAGIAVPSWASALVSLINLAAVAAPAGLTWALAVRFTPRMTGVRAAARAWTLAGIAGGLLGAVRVVPEPHNELLLLITAVVAAAGALLLRRAGGDTRVSPGRQRHLTGFGLAAGLLVLLPWLWAGALGGLTETILAVAAAATFGWLAATILGPALPGYARSRVWMVLVGGLAVGVGLMPLGAGLGGRGVNLAELTLLPALGFTAAALAHTAGLVATAGGAAVTPGRLDPAPMAALIAAGALGPLALVDPEETTALLGTSDVGWWALIATMLSVAVGLAAGTAYGLVLGPRRLVNRWLPATLALLMAAAGLGGYGLAGRPGFFGERLFVVLADQADLTGLAAIADRPARLRQTYQRLVEHGERTQAPLRQTLEGWGLHYTPYYLVNAILVDGGPVVRQWLAGRSDVDRVLLDQRLRPLPVGPPTEPGSAPPPGNLPQWNVTMIQAPRVWSEFGDEGKGIVIGSSDSGVDGGHPDLREGFRGGDDSWYDPWNGTRAPTDHGGHGTHTVGTALGRGGIGVAPQAQWIGCVNLDRNLGSPSRYLDCLQFMLAPFPAGANPWRDGHPDRAPDILTNSWGCPAIEGCDFTTLLPATAALRAAGIFFVAAAGNTGPGCSSVDDPPAPYPDVLTVGAVDKSRQVTGFSSRGPTEDHRTKPDVVAPGANILSALPGGTYGVFDGTSMATPHVAGVVALMWSANPDLIGDIDTTARILRDTATPARSADAPSACGPVANITGAGLVDAYAAVQTARQLPPRR